MTRNHNGLFNQHQTELQQMSGLFGLIIITQKLNLAHLMATACIRHFKDFRRYGCSECCRCCSDRGSNTSGFRHYLNHVLKQAGASDAVFAEE
ncbi:hypothetical protein ABES08_13865 [Peribacillus simplex]|uniref:hypothetical protein n=1 Tax=Peribacillus simplex TaxID=1478 RepID=UPI003D26A139